MTQEENLKKAKMLYKDANADQRYVLERLFPELKESYDERIRKWLMEMVEELRKANPTNADHNGMCSEALFWLEKQGEQNPTIEMKTPEESLDIDSDTYNKIVDECIYGERKPADKVEPKFKIGDWVVSPNSVYWHIDKISNNRYEVTSNTGESSNWNLDTNIYHKFTIQDAKDGDVLASKDGKDILIFRWLDSSTSFSSYYNIRGSLQIGWSNRSFIPATKEQREQLEKTMTDAGFTFDFDKKELKKIEQNPAWSEEDDENIMMIENRFSDLLEYIREDSSLTKHRKNTLKEDVIGYFNWIKSLKERYTWKPSDEQMEVLLTEVTAWTKGCPKQIVLESLYNDLKKLREE